MLLPRFKKVKLAIAEDGIALREKKGASRVLSSGPLHQRDTQAILDVLDDNRALFKGHSVALVLSNVFVRVLVIPWQPEVYARSDWEALANHAFRTQYGVAADGWKVKVHLGRYQQAVVAVAIDQALYDGLMQSAEQIGFDWQSIEPLTMRLLNHQQHHYPATLIVEPNYLMLCEQGNDGFRQFAVLSPPHSQEAKFAAQLVAKLALQMPDGLQSAQVIAYVSGKVKISWEQELQAMQQPLAAKIVLPKQQYASHANWLTVI